MIRSFRCPDTEALAGGTRVKRFVNIESLARRKLRQLQIANRLELLKGRLAGRYSIWINEQWRLCFRWSEAGAEDVEIIDYH